MTYLIYLGVVCLGVLFVFGMLVGAEEKVREPAPQEAPHEEHPELAPDIYAHVLLLLLVEAELRGLEQVRRNGDNEAGKGARV